MLVVARYSRYIGCEGGAYGSIGGYLRVKGGEREALWPMSA